jgi:hypothetical protein
MPNRVLSTPPARGSALSVRAIVETFAGDEARSILEGSPEALDRLVHSAGIISTAEEIDQQRPNSLIIVPPHVATSGDVSLELMLRRAAAVRISCIVIDAGPSAVPMSAARLAAQFRIVLWREPRLDPLRLLSRIEHLVRNPSLVGADLIRTVSETMTRPAADFGEIISRLTNDLGHPASLIGPDGTTIVGAALEATERLATQLSHAGHGTRDMVLDSTLPGRRLLAIPAFPLAPEPPPFWLVVQVPSGLDSRASHVFTAMRITSMALSTSLAFSSLDHERDNRQIAALLDQILEGPDELAVSDIENATVVGWQLFGWHTAVQVSAARSFADLPYASLAQSLTHALRAHGIDARPVRRGQTFVLWLTRAVPPTPAEDAELADRVRLALDDVKAAFPGVRLRAGVGEPREGVRGIAQSLEGARLALAFAESEHGSSVVQRSASMTANRLLHSWLPSGSAREAIVDIIQPLRSIDADGQLLATLRTYLDVESNASETASRLHVHRNTVLQRLTRVRELLPLDLDEPADRLAVQVALKLVT